MDSETLAERPFYWILAGRFVLILVLFSGAYFLLSDTVEALDRWRFALVVAGIIIATLLSLLWRVLGILEQGLVITQAFLDVGIVGLAVYWSGGITSPFAYLYPAVIISACFLDGRRGGTLALILSTASYAFACWAASQPAIPLREVLFTFFVNMAAFAVIASLGILLARRIHRAESRLATAEKNLRRIEKLHRYLANSLKSGLLAIDEKGTILSSNAAAHKLLGETQQDIIGQNIVDVWPESSEVVARLARNEETERMELPFGKTSAKRCFGISAFPLRDDRNGLLGHGIIFQDITQAKEEEARRERIGRLAALGEMAAGLAHEIRNPLASISGASQLLSESELVLPGGENLLAIIQREAGHLNDLTHSFLLYARPETRPSESFELGDLIETIIEGMKRRKDLPEAHITVEIPPGLRCHGDRFRFRQILENLLTNAHQALPSGGGKISVTGKIQDESLVITVEDTGTGIAEEDLPKVFNPFFTTRPDGTGLGLAIVHQLVASIGGDIAISSRKGQGTRCTLTFPSRCFGFDGQKDAPFH
ncbi:MAG: PAS domain S-box protein [Deltaproteobacteria bacterium]